MLEYTLFLWDRAGHLLLIIILILNRYISTLVLQRPKYHLRNNNSDVQIFGGGISRSSPQPRNYAGIFHVDDDSAGYDEAASRLVGSGALTSIKINLYSIY